MPLIAIVAHYVRSIIRICGAEMKLQIEEQWGKLWLDLLTEEGLITQIIVLQKRGIEKCFIGNHNSISLGGYYIADEDSD